MKNSNNILMKYMGYIKVILMFMFALYLPGNTQQIMVPAEIAYVTSELTSFDRFATKLIDGSGMSENPASLTSTHDIVSTNMWIGTQNDITPTVVFDMGEDVLLLETLIWNYNESGTGVTNRGVNQLEISVSSETSHSATTVYTNLGTFDFTEGGTNVQTKSTQGANVRLIQFTFVNNHGHPSFSGLSEVRFNAVRNSPIRIRNYLSPNAFKNTYHSSGTLIYPPDALVGQNGILSIYNFKGMKVNTISLNYTKIVNLKEYNLLKGPFIIQYK